MHDIIKILVDADHYLRCPVDTIARDGEGDVIKLEITFPEKLSSYWVYLDFKMPNGEKFKSPRLDVEGNTATYTVPPYVLIEGKLKMQVLFKNADGATWKSYKKPFTVRPSINAVDDIPDKEDFIAEAQKLLDDIKNSGGGGGASTLIINYDGENTASHTSQEIYDHVAKGGTVALIWNIPDGGRYYALADCYPEQATFSGALPDDHVDCTRIYVYEDGRCEVFMSSVANADIVSELDNRVNAAEKDIADLMENGGGGSNVLIVMEDEDDDGNPFVNYDSRQVYDHILGGGMVVLMHGAKVCHALQAIPQSVIFVSIDASGYLYRYELAGTELNELKKISLNKISKIDDIEGQAEDAMESATAANNAIGDIDTALDSIIAIQQSLIGGVA